MQFGQGGITLPDRDYYLKDDARSNAIRAAYQTYLVNTFQLLGDSPAAAAQNAATVQRLETRLAQASRTPVARRDPQKNYNKLTVAQASQDYPNLNLPLLLQQNGLGPPRLLLWGSQSSSRKQTPCWAPSRWPTRKPICAGTWRQRPCRLYLEHLPTRPFALREL